MEEVETERHEGFLPHEEPFAATTHLVAVTL